MEFAMNTEGKCNVDKLLFEIELFYKKYENRKMLGSIIGGALTLGWIIIFGNLERHYVMFVGGAVLLFCTAILATILLPDIPDDLTHRVKSLNDVERLLLFEVASDDPDLLKWISRTFSFSQGNHRE